MQTIPLYKYLTELFQVAKKEDSKSMCFVLMLPKMTLTEMIKLYKNVCYHNAIYFLVLPNCNVYFVPAYVFTFIVLKTMTSKK